MPGAESDRWNAPLYDERHQFVWREGRDLVDLLAPQPNERILDLGCGTGHLTHQIAERGASVIGFDRSPAMLNQARSLFPRIRFELADARNFAFGSDFDAVFSNAALHWITPPETVARSIVHALKPGGRLVCELGAQGNLRQLLAAVSQAASEVGIVTPPENYFPSLGRYAAVLEDAGLDVINAQVFDRPTPLSSETGLIDWLRMFRSSLVDDLSPAVKDRFISRLEAIARPHLYRDQTWIADYRRLRVIAINPHLSEKHRG